MEHFEDDLMPQTIQITKNKPDISSRVLFNKCHPGVALHKETSHLIWKAKSNDRFHYEMQHWDEIG